MIVSQGTQKCDVLPFTKFFAVLQYTLTVYGLNGPADLFAVSLMMFSIIFSK